MLKIGITGGIGSGKSVVSKLLSMLNIPVYISDIEAKKLTISDSIIRRNLVKLLGEEVYEPNGALNKELLATYLFASPQQTDQVNAIIHPQVKKDFQFWASQQSVLSQPIIGLESAILFEAGFDGEVDICVMVYAPLELRLKRAMERDGVSRNLIMDRINAQMSDELKKDRSDYVIYNDNERALIPQVLELISFLSKKYDYLCFAKK